MASQLVNLCQRVGISSLAQLRRALRWSSGSTRSYLQKQWEVDKTTWEASPTFVVMLVLIGAFYDKLDVASLADMGWAEGIASDVLEIARSTSGGGAA